MAKLQPGDKAPAFNLTDADGKKVSLSSFKGSKVIVYFYPRDDTPGCTKEACQFNDNLSAFKKAKVPVIGISPDSSASHIRFRDKYGLKFTLLSDPTKETMEAYGAYGEKMMYGKPVTGVIRSTFIVDEKGKIARAWYSVKADGHAAKVLEELG
jgi:peroxiredoxin Q/BCP